MNLAPADIRKTGPSFDLPIALGILTEEMNIPQELLNETLVVGELALDGTVRSVPAILPTVIFAREK